jgi:hypothetical protein
MWSAGRISLSREERCELSTTIGLSASLGNDWFGPGVEQGEAYDMSWWMVVDFSSPVRPYLNKFHVADFSILFFFVVGTHSSLSFVES